MLLASERWLDLDDSVLKYLPELPQSWNRVTLRLILNHQSGIAQFTTPQRQLLDLEHDYTDAELIQLAASAESVGRQPLERVYRVEGADMVEFDTVRYTADSTTDDLELLREY